MLVLQVLRGLVVAHQHGVLQLQLGLLLTHLLQHHPRRRNVTTSRVGLRNIHKNLAQNGEPQRYRWGMQKISCTHMHTRTHTHTHTLTYSYTHEHCCAGEEESCSVSLLTNTCTHTHTPPHPPPHTRTLLCW